MEAEPHFFVTSVLQPTPLEALQWEWRLRPELQVALQVEVSLQHPAPTLALGTHHLPHLSWKPMLFKFRFIPAFQALINLAAIHLLLFE